MKIAQLPSAGNAKIIDPFIQSPRPSRNIKMVFELCRRAGFLFVALITTSSQLYIILQWCRRAHAINRNRPRGIKAHAFEKLKRVAAIHHHRHCAAPNTAESPSPPPPRWFLPAREAREWDYPEKSTRIVRPLPFPPARVHAPPKITRSRRQKSIYNVCTFTCHSIGGQTRVGRLKELGQKIYPF